jgi:NTP pyrophosphatase (non-canonical NTP hydrolase)
MRCSAWAARFGEIFELFKKHFYQGHDLDNDKVMEEIGDVLWYADALARANGFTLEEVAAANIAKLQARYPDGRFDAERSKNREA